MVIPGGEGLEGVVWDSTMKNVVSNILKTVDFESYLWRVREEGGGRCIKE